MEPSKFDIHHPQTTNFQYFDSSYPLNLNLSVTRSLVQEINEKLESPRNQLGSSESHPSTSAKMKNARNLADKDKSKNINFSATYLQIGQWSKTAIHNMSIVVKLYLKKKKLAIEALDGSLKTKIESKFSGIAAIRFLNVNTSNVEVMEILLDAKPEFFREINPRPMKHTDWATSQDFTDGQASLYRKHILRFFPGSLEKHRDKIVAADPFLQSLTSQSFPDEENPRFDHGLTQISFQNPHHSTDPYNSPAFGFPTMHLPEPNDVVRHQISRILQQPIAQSGYPGVDELDYSSEVSGYYRPVTESVSHTSYNFFVDPTPNYSSVTQESSNYVGSENWMDQQQFMFSSQFSTFQAPYCDVEVFPSSGVGIPNQGDQSIYRDSAFDQGYGYDQQGCGYDRWT